MDGGIFFNLQSRRLERLGSRFRAGAGPGPGPGGPLQLLQADFERSLRHFGAVDLPLQDRRVVSVLLFISLIQAELLGREGAALPPRRHLGGGEAA